MANRFLVWVGAGVVAAGVSTAAVAGAGTAAADDGSAGDGGRTATSDMPKTSDGQGDSGIKPLVSAEKIDEQKPTTAGDKSDERTAPRRANNDRQGTSVEVNQPRVHLNLRPSSTEVVQKSESTTDAQGKQATSNQPHTQSVPEADTVTKGVVAEASIETAPASKPIKPNVVETVGTAMSSAITTVLSPFTATGTPKAPGAQPQLWTLAAAARREFESGSVSPSVAKQVAPVDNSLTYTPPPTFLDRISLMFQDAMSFISKVTGVNVQAVLGSVLSTGTPPFFLTFGLDTQRTVWTAEDGVQWQVWEFDPANPTGKTVVAFHGGGFIYQPSVFNWIDYTNMARQTGATVVVPLYPLATTEAGRATVVIPEAADFIAHQIDLHGPENVSLYADSAGSIIAIAAVRQLLLAGKPVPSSMVLNSLAADGSLSNPDIRNIDDPIFDVNNVQDVWESHWYDGITDRRDPLVSALYFEPEILKALPPTTIYVGEREILYPDTLLLHQRAVDEGAPISVVVGTGLIHDWPVLGSPPIGFSQSAAVRPDIYRQLGLTSDA